MEENAYEKDVHAHKQLVGQSLRDIALDLVVRSNMHDQSKFDPEEREVYERVTPEFAGVTYGTPEYEAVKAKLGPALDHHYRYNDHHPEHFENGIAQMDLAQLTEMVADWYAAMRRDPNAHLIESMEKLRDKYKVEPQLYNVILNTVLWLRNGSQR